MGYVALCGWKEARGEGEDGICGVLSVIRNRALHWYYAEPESYKFCIYYPLQFTSMSDRSDPQYHLMPADNDPVWQFCLIKARELIADKLPDNTFGAMYYCNPQTMNQNGWFKKHIIDMPVAHPRLAVIGRHWFYA